MIVWTAQGSVLISQHDTRGCFATALRCAAVPRCWTLGYFWQDPSESIPIRGALSEQPNVARSLPLLRTTTNDHHRSRTSLPNPPLVTVAPRSSDVWAQRGSASMEQGAESDKYSKWLRIELIFFFNITIIKCKQTEELYRTSDLERLPETNESSGRNLMYGNAVVMRDQYHSDRRTATRKGAPPAAALAPTWELLVQSGLRERGTKITCYCVSDCENIISLFAAQNSNSWFETSNFLFATGSLELS